MRLPLPRSSALLLAILAVGPARAGEWSRDPLWNDGRAEVATYASERVVYGKPRSFEESLVTVKEDLRLDTLVKADQPSRHRTARVFKLNIVQKFETQNYPYSYLASVFVKDEDARRVLKITVGSQEWCGNTFKIFKAGGPSPAGVLTWHSYFDGEADGEARLAVRPGDLFEDQLPLTLRALPLQTGYEQRARIWESLVTNRGTEPRAAAAVIKVVGEEAVRTGAGAIPSWKVAVQRENGTDVYWIEKAEPRILTRMETTDGRKRLLKGRARWAYWDRGRSRPSDLRPSDLRPSDLRPSDAE